MAKKWLPMLTKIVRTPGTCGGLWRIQGTRTPVGTIARCFQDGVTIWGLCGANYYPHLTSQQVEDALRFYCRQPLRARRRILRGKE